MVGGRIANALFRWARFSKARQGEHAFQKRARGIDFFLFPNNSDDGDFEKLVLAIAHEERKGVFTCFNGYETCVLGNLF